MTSEILLWSTAVLHDWCGLYRTLFVSSPSPGGKPISIGDLWNFVIPPRTGGVIFGIEFVDLLKGPTCRARQLSVKV